MRFLCDLLARAGYVKLARYGLVLGADGRITAIEPAAPAPVGVAPALAAAPALAHAETVTAAPARKPQALIVDDVDLTVDDLTAVDLTEVELDEVEVEVDDDWEWQA